jgi:outer membrane protein, heavy metal efflux system
MSAKARFIVLLIPRARGRMRERQRERARTFRVTRERRCDIRPHFIFFTLLRDTAILLAAARGLRQPRAGEMKHVQRAILLAVSVLLMSVVALRSARADVVPTPPDLTSPLSLDEAMRLFHARGLDLLIAEAAVRNAEGAVQIANAIPNPVVSGSVGNAFTYSNSAASQQNCLQNGASCSPWIYNIGLTDSAALEDTLSGKRYLRVRVARNALAAAKLSRVDAERTISFQVKAAYAAVVQAVLAHDFAKEMQATNVTTLKRFQDRFKSGAINEGDLQRIEVQKLEADQALDTAAMNLREARVALAFLLGVRGTVTDFDVDTKVLDYATPAALQSPTEGALLHMALDHRPDLHSAGYNLLSSEAQVQLVKRQRFPDMTFGINYAWGGFGGFSTNGPIQAPTLTFSLSMVLPVFYQLSGEVKQAEAQVDTNALTHAKLSAQVINDVSSALAAFLGSKRLVERMEGPRREGGGILASAKGAFEILARQYDRGTPGVTVTDFLDALRTYISTKLEYYGDLANYWTAVFQLEQAVGVSLR